MIANHIGALTRNEYSLSGIVARPLLLLPLMMLALICMSYLSVSKSNSVSPFEDLKFFFMSCYFLFIHTTHTTPTLPISNVIELSTHLLIYWLLYIFFKRGGAYVRRFQMMTRVPVGPAALMARSSANSSFSELKREYSRIALRLAPSSALLRSRVM